MNRRKPGAAGQDHRADAGADAKTPDAKTPDAKTPAALCDLGHQHLNAGRILDAQMCCEQALVADANCADAMHLMGLLSLGADQPDHAVEWFIRAVRHEEKSAYLLSLGKALRHQGRLDDAFRAFDRAVEIDIDSPLAWKALAQLLADLNRREEARLAFQHVLKLDPEDADAAHRAGLWLLLAGKREEALGFFDRSGRLRPDHAPTQQMRTLALALPDRALFEQTLSEMDRTPALDPDTALIHNDVGDVYRRSGRHEEALIWFEKALALRPDFTLARSNKAYSLARLHRFDEALANYAALKAVDPAGVEWNQALLHLLLGNFEAGWIGREARWKVPSLQLARYNFSQPMWLGREPIAGRTILIYQEEGLGDTIQFARYVPMVAAQGARVILMVADTLVPLLSKLPGVTRCIPMPVNQALEFDTHCGITSLPLAFATRLETIPSAVPYLPAPDPSRVRVWEERLGPRQKLRVGLVWSGNPGQSDDHNRSMPLRTLSPLLDLDATFVSLQKDPRPGDRELLAQTRIIDLTTHLTDFAETAALVSCLDLVISVCTSTAHLAGALACPTWVLLPRTPDWRWLLDRDDSPWYPTARLFRQDESRDYGRVIARVQAELRESIASWEGKTDSLSPADQAASPLAADDAGSLHLMGQQALQEKQFDQAVEWLSRAIRRNPKPAYLTMLGTALLGQGRREEALQVFDKAVQLKPDDPEPWKNLGFALVEVGRPADAIQCLQQTLKLDSRDADAAYRVSLLLYQEERYEEAVSTFSLAAQLQPDHFPTVYMRALALQNLKRFEEALADNERAHALDPNNPDACHNMGNVLRALFRQQEAIAWHDKSLALRPNFAATLGNKAVALAELRRFDEAIKTYREAIAADPSYAVAQWNLGLLHLLLGDFESGWAGQEARWKVGSLSLGYPNTSAPKWLGKEPIAGKTILACAHEGLGDTIQFVRYVPMLAASGARVVLVVQDSLCTLLSTMEGVAQCLPLSSSSLPDCDFHVPLSSLPLAFGTRLNTIPAQKSYLPAPPIERVQAWETRLGAHEKLRVGLAWSGNPRHNNDRNRSAALRLLAPLFDLDAVFISLQKDPRPEDRSILAEHREVIDLTADLTDFVETAALIACLDLVIAVDTSVAHLAAALGCPTWILLPYTPDYRWLLDREDSPWYPTARLFRQDERHDYGCVIERVRDRLGERIETWCADVATLSRSADLVSLGNSLKRQGRLDDAFRAFDRAVEIDIDSPAAWKALAQLLADLDRRNEAALSFQYVLKLDPDDADAAYQAGFLSLLSGRSQDALALFDRSCQLRSDHAPTLQMRGSVLKILGRLAEAEADMARAHALAPDDAEICNSMGALLCELGQLEQALTWFDKALKRRSGLTLAHYNKAQTLGRLRRYDEAFAIYAALKTANPDDAESDWNAALLHLLTGNFEAGWIGREARWKIPRLAMPKHDLAQPMWLGQEPLEGKTVLIDQDEGLGDVIQFMRYVPMVAAKGARVVLLVDKALVPLLSKFPEVTECIPKLGIRQVVFDFYCGISSLPLAFGTRLETIPSTVPYLPAPDPVRVRVWEERLGPRGKMRVGLVWSGNPSHRDDHNRSVALRALTPLLDLDATFVSLQKEPRPADQATLRERPEIVDLTAHLNNLAETAALMSCLDLVITVDTSIAHLAGAMALPTWILLPHIPDWRWLLDRDDSPWYPTALLFRQDESRDYGRVIERVRSQLAERIETWCTCAANPTWGPSADAKTPAALCELGYQHLQAGRALDAQSCCQQALAAHPNCAAAMHLMGLLSLHAGQADRAIEWLVRAIRQDPKSQYVLSLGEALKRQGRLEEALKAFDKAVQLDVESPAAWKAFARLLADSKHQREAALAFEHVLKLDPEDADAAYQAGFLHLLSGKPQDARDAFDRADQLRPGHAPTVQMRALALQSLDRHEESSVEMARAHALDPGDADICNNMGVISRRNGRQLEALAWFEKALTLRPDLKPAQNNKAYVLGRLRRFDEAFAVYAAVKASNPDDAEPDWDIGLLQLLTGNFEAGWVGREARWKLSSLPVARYDFPQPMWLGREPIAGKTILIYQDEGLGDVIHFARYVPMVAELGARVILLVNGPLAPLLSKLPGVTDCVSRLADIEVDFDVHCAIASLPLAFGTRLETIPSTVPYLPAPEQSRVQAWRQRLGPHDKFRVGLVWSGNPKHGDDRNRSLPLRALAPLLELDANFVSLQKDPRAEDQVTLRERSEIIDLTDCLTDFAETAALLSCLDLVISVDTSMAHLAGALARPTWVLLPHTPDWRWLLDRDDSPWYPTAVLFRQDESRDYGRVIERVRSQLVERIETWRTSAVTLTLGLSADTKAPAALCELACQHRQAGRTLDARSCCEQALAADANCAEAMHLLGLLSLDAEQLDHAVDWFARAVHREEKSIYLVSLGNTLKRQGRLDDAFRALDRAVERDVDSPTAWKALAQLLADLNRHHEAALSFQHVLKLDTCDPDAAYQAGFLFLQCGKAGDALALLDFAELLRPDHGPTLQMRALAIGSLGRLEEAVALLSRAHALLPEDADICSNMGVFLQRLGRHEEALTWLDKSLASKPDFNAAYHAGLLLIHVGKTEDALAYLERADQLRPDHAPILQARAIAVGGLQRLDEAVALLSRAHALAPDDAGICNSMGLALQWLDRPEKALSWFDKALARKPEFAGALINKGSALAHLHRFDEALAVYAAVKTIDPDHVEGEWCTSLLHLLTGNLEAGWAGREVRWKIPEQPLARYGFSEPMWLGQQPVHCKTILVHQDEGLGDVIQFVRYVPMLVSLGARVILLADDALVPLLSKLPGVLECLPKSAYSRVTFDVHCAITSLPLAFNTRLATIPAVVPYLPAPEEARRQIWERRLGPHDKMRVGLVWSGNPKHTNDRYRSIALRDLLPLLDLDASFVSLQKDPRPADEATLREQPGIVDLTDHFNDLTETAALISCLDLVITVDTSIAHLAGAMALPTWILLPYTPDWRWLLDRDDSPWYPTALLFRQDESRDYGRVIERVRSQLVARIEARRRAAGLRPDEKAETGPDDTRTPAALCELARQHLQSGRALDARMCCERALATDPNCAEAMHLMGLVSLHADQADHAIEWLARAIQRDARPQYVLSLGEALKRQGRTEEALKAFDKAVELDVGSTVAWKALAQLLADLNRHHEAALAFQHVVELDPRDADAAYQGGFLFFRAGKPDHALTLLDRAEQLRPDNAPILQMRALAIGGLGRSEEAVALLSSAHALAPDDADICNNMGVLLQRLGRQEEALTWFDKSLARKPDFTAAYQAGLLLFHGGKPEQALAYLDRAEELRPDHAPILQARAMAISALQRFEEAVALLSRAHALSPDDAEICNNMGVSLQRLGRLEEALTWFDKALARRPEFVWAFTNKGLTLGHLHRFDEALAVYAALRTIDPDCAEAEWCASLLHLLTGNLEAGWAGREARWKIPNLPIARHYQSQPMWRGEQPIDGKTILIHQDEGLGDVIQFVRYVPMLASLGARVILLVDDVLVPLLSKLSGVRECVPKSTHTSISFDIHCAVTSLPLAFNTNLATIPATVPYLPAPEEARRQTWERRLGPHDRMRVGLVWSGNPKQANDHFRSLPLRDLLPLADLDAAFVSLQKDPRAADHDALREWSGLVDPTVHLTDFAETAALVSCLDLVISVCTSTAHLAGALGCPTWVLLSYTPDWRWLLDRDDSPWYPTALLFRQDESRDYGRVIERVRRQLAERIEAWRAGQNRG